MFNMGFPSQACNDLRVVCCPPLLMAGSRVEADAPAIGWGLSAQATGISAFGLRSPMLHFKRGIWWGGRNKLNSKTETTF